MPSSVIVDVMLGRETSKTKILGYADDTDIFNFGGVRRKAHVETSLVSLKMASRPKFGDVT